MSINWGDLSFSEIEPLSSWEAPEHGGIYAITFRPDYKNKPQTHRIIYFGETDAFDGRGIGESHHKYECWREKADGNQLYVSTHHDDNEGNRQRKEKQLIEKYTPSCNDEYT